MSGINLKTQRLIIRHLALEDARSLFDYRSLDEVTRFQTFKPKNPADATDFINSTSSEMNIPDSWYQLGLFDKDNGKHIGDIGIHFLDNTEEAEIGCTVTPERWGKGYATESLKIVISFLFNTLNKKRVVAYINIENIPSLKLFERLGFQLLSQDNDEIIYELTNKSLMSNPTTL